MPLAVVHQSAATVLRRENKTDSSPAETAA